MIILMGVLGAGKSVQGELLSSSGDYIWLSTGAFIRENATGELREKMLRGELLDDSELYKILTEYFSSGVDVDKVVLDGFPRTLAQAEWLIKQHEQGSVKLSCVIFLNLPKEVAKKRLMARGREDDKEEIIERRISDFENQTLPVVSWIKSKGVKLIEVDANQTVDQVHDELISKLSKN